MSEEAEQIEVFKWAGVMRNKYPELDFLFHVPNGGSRDVREAVNLKRQGVKPGVPDLCLPVPKGDYAGLFIEMKAGRNKTSSHQDKWLEFLTKAGHYTAICYSWGAATKVIEHYLLGDTEYLQEPNMIWK